MRTSAFRTSIVLSLDAGPIRSISALLLSILHTETRLLVTLWAAGCTRHGPTLKGGGCAVVGREDEDDPAGAGDAVRLALRPPTEEEGPML